MFEPKVSLFCQIEVFVSTGQFDWDGRELGDSLTIAVPEELVLGIATHPGLSEKIVEFMESTREAAEKAIQEHGPYVRAEWPGWEIVESPRKRKFKPKRD